jgi:hypothetical protein
MAQAWQAVVSKYRPWGIAVLLFLPLALGLVLGHPEAVIVGPAVLIGLTLGIRRQQPRAVSGP